MSILAHSALYALDLAGLLKLLLISLVAGIGISAVGPGGVFMTIGLYAFTALSPSVVAGTAIVTHVGTGLVGTAAYLRSGHFRRCATRRIAVILCATACLGIPAGIWINAHVSRQGFGVLLGILTAAIGALVCYRQWPRRAPGSAPDSTPGTGAGAARRALPDVKTALIGLGVAVAASLFGIGGPMLCVPLLVAAGVPMLPALAAAQAQSVVGSGFGALGYALQGAIDWPMAVFIAIPQMLGVIVGWKIAHAVPARGLAFALAFTLIGLAPYLALGGS
ncbi:MAG TPA: sulfite exporter TauE/SafE family protein [Acetobacteraceae bacterium]|nr:sulfite exporter TauE/SafE family protein [Acetobacteraceae bacterium]